MGGPQVCDAEQNCPIAGSQGRFSASDPQNSFWVQVDAANIASTPRSTPQHGVCKKKKTYSQLGTFFFRFLPTTFSLKIPFWHDQPQPEKNKRPQKRYTPRHACGRRPLFACRGAVTGCPSSSGSGSSSALGTRPFCVWLRAISAP